jgi:hypothetical protein
LTLPCSQSSTLRATQKSQINALHVRGVAGERSAAKVGATLVAAIPIETASVHRKHYDMTATPA